MPVPMFMVLSQWQMLLQEFNQFIWQGGDAHRPNLRPKDSNATVGVHDRSTQKAPERYDRVSK